MAKEKTCPLMSVIGRKFTLCIEENCAWWDDHPDRTRCVILNLIHLIGIEDELEMGRRGE